MKIIKHLFLVVALLFTGLAHALTPAQALTLKAAINANATWAAYPMSADGYIDLSVVLNEPVAPSFTVWRTNVPTAQVGIAFNSSELSGMTTANTNRLGVMADYSGGTFDASRTDVRAGFDSVFGGAGGALTRAALLITWKRLATGAEKALAAGTGSDAAPATMGYEGSVSPAQVQQARTAL